MHTHATHPPALEAQTEPRCGENTPRGASRALGTGHVCMRACSGGTPLRSMLGQLADMAGTSTGPSFPCNPSRKYEEKKKCDEALLGSGRPQRPILKKTDARPVQPTTAARLAALQAALQKPRLAGPSSMTGTNEPTVAGSSPPVHVHRACCRSRLSRRPDIRYQML